MVLLPDDARIDARHENGTPSRVTLQSPAIIDDVPCAPGDHAIALHPNGRLEDATLASRCEVRGWALETGDYVALRDDGSIAHAALAGPRAFAGRDDVAHVVFDEASKPVALTVGDATFDGSGRLLKRRLLRAEVIDGVPCEDFATFHPNGRLASAPISEPMETPHGTLPAGSIVSFENDGALSSALVGDECVLGGQPFSARSPVQFGQAGPVLGGWTFYTTPPGPPDFAVDPGPE